MLKQFSFHEAFNSLPEHTVQLISLFSDSQREFLAGYIKAERPSMQSLKMFIEKMRDFAPFLISSRYDRDEWLALTDKRSPQHIAADQLLQKLKYAKSNDSFESGQLQWSFTAKSVTEYKKALQKLLDESNTVDELFKIIDLYHNKR